MNCAAATAANRQTAGVATSADGHTAVARASVTAGVDTNVNGHTARTGAANVKLRPATTGRQWAKQTGD
jgi:hypothetical protein